jgi:DNA helicase TIP49 (TBP-interacting protein)
MSTVMELVIREETQHQAFCARIAPHRWIARQAVDEKMASLIQRGLDKSICAHFYGGHGTGKTALICRLSELLQTKQCYVVTRFVHLTDSAIFANELFKNIFLWVSICVFDNQDKYI